MSGQTENVELDILAADQFTSLPLHVQCIRQSTPDLQVKTHYELLCPAGLVHDNELESIMRLARTIITFHVHGHTGVLIGHDDGANDNTWWPLVDLNSVEGAVFVSTFEKHVRGLLPYSPEDCLNKVNQLKGAAK